MLLIALLAAVCIALLLTIRVVEHASGIGAKTTVTVTPQGIRTTTTPIPILP